MFRFEGRQMQAHRASWLIHRGDIPDNLWVLHKCDNPPCVNPGHLFLGTYQDNIDDMVSKGRHSHGDRQWLRKNPERVNRGEAVPWSKLTADTVREIRTLFATGDYSKMDLVRQFGVTHPTIRRILSRKIWRHICAR
jgi:hypothetical protein